MIYAFDHVRSFCGTPELHIQRDTQYILQIPRASCIQGGVWGSMLSKEPKNNHAVETGNLVEDPASRSSTTYRAERGASNAHQPLAQPCCTDLSSPLLCQSYANPLIPHFAVLFAGFPMVSWIFLTFLLFKDAGPPVTQQIQHQFDIFWHPWVQWMSASIVVEERHHQTPAADSTAMAPLIGGGDVR